MRVVDARGMARYERWAIDTAGLPEMVLMEHAALAVADAVAREFPDSRVIGLLCGPGNNGGDGLAAARLLATRGYEVVLALASASSRYRETARAQLAICRHLGIEPTALGARDGLPECDVWVDALFGTGLDRPLTGAMEARVEALNDSPSPVLSVDLPSGLLASEARFIGPYVQAEVTVTFGAPKVAQVLDPTRSAVGRLLVADLGLPWRDLDGDESGPTLELVEQAQLGGLLPLRARDSHKGDFGHLAVVAGSVGMAGAARLAGVAALRSGAGLVTLAVPGGIRGECAASTPEVMTVALGDGSRNLGEADLELLEAPLRRASAVVLGPGLGASVATATAVQRLVAEVPVPLVLDADGLNALRGDLGLIARRGGVTLLTPHPGEMARLLGISAEEVQADRIAAVRAAAARAGCVVVLKGSRSLTCDPGGRVMINTTGNPGMATAGCGDVLAGVLGALLAAGLDALSAAVLGVWVHGHAGDLAVGRYGETSLIAGDLVDQLPESFLQLQDPDETNRENGAEEREAPRQRDRGSDSHG